MPHELLNDLVLWTQSNLPPGPALPSVCQRALPLDCDERWRAWCEGAHEEVGVPLFAKRRPGELAEDWHMRTATQRHRTVSAEIARAFPSNVPLHRLVRLVVPLLWGTSWYHPSQHLQPQRIEEILHTMAERAQ